MMVWQGIAISRENKMLDERKSAQRKLIGKTISGIIVLARCTGPLNQLILTFTDGTSFEWFSWNGDITATKSLMERSHDELLQGDCEILFDSRKDEDLTQIMQ